MKDEMTKAIASSHPSSFRLNPLPLAHFQERVR
jgi:hypothetical protein